MREVVVQSVTNLKAALDYLVFRVEGNGAIATRFGIPTLYAECAGIDLVTSSAPPLNQDFFIAWGGEAGPCEEWLINEVLEFLAYDPRHVVLFDDYCSSPSDPGLMIREHPPFWSYRERILWPVTCESANNDSVEQAMIWAPGMYSIVNFCRLPTGLPSTMESRSLSDRDFVEIATSLNFLATDVFDGGGFMVWKRRPDFDLQLARHGWIP